MSWWGPNEKDEQSRFPALLAGAAETDPAFRVALYYEKEGTADPSVAELKDDLEYISARYTNQHNYLWVGGRPVLFVYNADDTDCTVVDRWKAADAGSPSPICATRNGVRSPRPLVPGSLRPASHPR